VNSLTAFRAVRTIGTVLPSEALSRAVDLRMPGQSALDYRLTPGMAVNAAVARAWDAALGAHRAWKTALERLPDADPATALTRDKWLLPLLYELGHGRPEVLAAGIDLPPGLGETRASHYPISHQLSWPAPGPVPDAEVAVPLHLVGGGVSLDSATPGVTARAPQSMVQDFLNRSRRCLWGIVSNGHTVRLLRDASSLTKQSYVEFDLDDIFDNQRYAEFRLFFLTIHASRFSPLPRHMASAATEPSPPESREVAVDDDALGQQVETGDIPTSDVLTPESCWLEQWRTVAIADGTRALDALRDGVALALTHLGTGFVSHPGNNHLVAMLTASPDADKDLHRALLRTAYRLIVLFVAEDRDLLHTASNDTPAQALYREYFSTRRLRHIATTRTGTRHTDLWDAHLIVTDALAGDGLPELALPGLAASLFDRDALGVLAGAALPNRSLLAAVRSLAQIVDPKTGVPRPVDYRNLDSEELGGVYEGLLAYTPRYDPTARTFTLDIAAGNDRKKSGSYYTPSDLIALVLDEALDPLIGDAVRSADPQAALLDLTVVDPAVGSGHFVVAAARRIATALAGIRTGDTEPGPQALRAATADVIERCIYGVDLNDLATEITKVALWLEAFDGSRPFAFLDAHLKVGNSLLGTTPALLRKNIPDAAFIVLGDDDKTWTSKLKARNKAERARHAGQLTMFDSDTLDVETAALTKRARELEEAPAATLAQVRARADAWRRLEDDPKLAARKLAADTWCAAFVQAKSSDHGQGITHDTLQQIVENPDTIPATILETVRQLAQQYRFFHWHLEFPGIFTVPDSDTPGVDPATGWQGGFSCVVGNPPWETLQLEDKQFFSAVGRTDIAEAKTAAIRARMIRSLASEDQFLLDAYQKARRVSDATTHLVRGGHLPLTAHGKINTYAVFAETFRTITAAAGAAGIITPTGLATDNTTAPFFADTLSERRLIAFYDFENEAKVFPGVDHRVRFAVTAIAGHARPAGRTRFAFLTRHVADVPDRTFDLAADEVLTLNPNTGTLPVFRTRADADITLGVYRRHPVLIHDERVGGNTWGLTFSQGLFNMASDSGFFHQALDLAGAAFNGWSYDEQNTEYLPLYEAKMLGHFDHRFSTYRDATQAQLNVGSLPRPTAEQHDDPNMEPLARYWVGRPKVSDALDGKWEREWLLGWRDIARASDMRTFVPSVLPASAVGHKFPLAFPEDPRHGALLHAIWSTMIFDYVARQKISGTGMTYFIVKQIACPTPDTFAQPAGWQTGYTLAEWVIPYAHELSYTSWRLQPYAQEMGDDGPPFRWNPERRSLLRADLDAAMLHVYGLTRQEAEHVLDSFPVVRKYEERDHGEYQTRRLVLDAYDRMATATAHGGSGWTPLAELPAGQGPRHPAEHT
jgi:hypothetical protein